MTPVSPDMSFFFFAIKAAFAMMSLIGAPLLLGMLIYGVVKNRTGVAVLAGALLLIGLLFGTGAAYFLVSVPYAHVTNESMQWDRGHFNAPTHEFEQASNVTWRFSFIFLFLIAAAVVAGIFAFFRWAAVKRSDGSRGSWSPALRILVPLLPLLIFMGLFGTVRVQRSESRSNHHELSSHSTLNQAYLGHQQVEIAHQQAELAQRAAKLNNELQHRIATMDIHKLMDMIDAPRIMLPMPAPAILATLATTPAPAALPPSPPNEAPRPDAPSKQASMEARAASGPAESKSSVQDNQLIAEANAGIESIVGEQPSSAVAALVADDGTARHVIVADTASTASDTTSDGAQSDASDGSNPTSSNSSQARSVASEDGDEVEKETNSVEEKLSTPIRPRATIDETDRRRPEWISHPPKRIGDVQRQVVVTDEWSTEEECERARNVALMRETYARVQTLTGGSEGLHSDDLWSPNNAIALDKMRELNRAGITIDYVRREIAKEDFLETTERSIGPMMKLYTLIEFTPEIDRQLRQRWEARERERRFWKLGAGATWVLSLLGSVYGLLKIDTWTKGYYTKRLFLGVPAAIIGLIGLFALLKTV